MKENRRPSGRRGFATIYITLTALVLVPVVGLAIDFSMLYNVKARLQAAVDAAAIGSGNMLERSTDMTNLVQVANIKDAAQRFFNANYPLNYWGSTKIYYDSFPSEDVTRTRTIYVHAAYDVPMIFLRAVGISTSRVAAQATVKVRFVTMMIVVDRSGSVVNRGAVVPVTNALHTFVADPATSIFVNQRDYVGLVSFGGNWRLDFAPKLNFQTAVPDIGAAIDAISFDPNSSTNTADGLWQAYYQLRQLDQTGSLNVIVLLTDGRPSAFSGTFTMSKPSCSANGTMAGWIGANIGSAWPPLPPFTTGSVNTFGVAKTVWPGPNRDQEAIGNYAGCNFSSQVNNISSDMATFPAWVTPVDNPIAGIGPFSTTLGPVGFTPPDTNMNDPRSVRYAAFNVADNIATVIRQDTRIRPVLFVIGLNESGGEPLDPDWLARVANDAAYRTAGGNSVFQAGQTPGNYYDVTTADLGAAFTRIASQILRLSQ